ncbi:MAG: hypothetical protein PHW10_02425 [Candidatus Peribacteraceae bacterium]|nr:hypothetical protein [Candidatus Peribacteraceae bacterium]
MNEQLLSSVSETPRLVLQTIEQLLEEKRRVRSLLAMLIQQSENASLER